MRICDKPACERPGQTFVLSFSGRSIRVELCPKHAEKLTRIAALGRPARGVETRGTSRDRLASLIVHDNDAEYDALADTRDSNH
jgi:hypothetical protein